MQWSKSGLPVELKPASVRGFMIAGRNWVARSEGFSVDSEPSVEAGTFLRSVLMAHVLAQALGEGACLAGEAAACLAQAWVSEGLSFAVFANALPL